MNNPYSDEKSYMDDLEDFLKKYGFETWREVCPDNSRLRVDLIFYRNEFGFIAVEGKNLNSLRQGGKIAKAINQINKYKELTFFNGIKIPKWCLTSPCTIPTICFNDDKKEEDRRLTSEMIHFIRNFIKTMWGLSFLEFRDCGSYKKIVIDYLKTDSIHISKYGIKGGLTKDGDSIPEL